MTTMASVKVAREKLLELLREAKDERLKKFDEAVERYNEKLVELRQGALEAASKDLSKEANLDKLGDALGAYLSSKKNRRYQYEETLGVYISKNDRENIIERRYDNAIKLVTISSDDSFKVTSNTEFGMLLGL